MLNVLLTQFLNMVHFLFPSPLLYCWGEIFQQVILELTSESKHAPQTDPDTLQSLCNLTLDLYTKG